MAVNESARAAGIDLAHVVRDIVGDEVRVELQRQLGGLSDRERRIMDMWPRFEDGKPVWIGDAVELDDWSDEVFYQVHIGETGFSLYTETHDEWHDSGDMVKRPAPKALDADGVEIKVGDTVWHEDGSELHVIGFGDAQDGETMLVVEYAAGPTKWGEVRCLSVTHTRPDSWEQLEEDIAKYPCCYAEEVKGSKFNSCSECPWHSEVIARDIIRRAKALAGVEVGE